MNAIILAAGISSRLYPITKDIPKCLLKINNIPIIERQIQYLREIDVQNIYIVVGYLAEKLDYLIDKYGVTLIYNDKYSVFNNIYSLYKIANKLGNTIILEADVYFNKNIFLQYNELLYMGKYSVYFSILKSSKEEEWELKTDSKENLIDIEIYPKGCNKKQVMSGISYWTEDDGILIREKIIENIEKNNSTTIYWDVIIKQNLNLLNIKVLHISDIFEIDTVFDYQNVICKHLSSYKES